MKLFPQKDEKELRWLDVLAGKLTDGDTETRHAAMLRNYYAKQLENDLATPVDQEAENLFLNKLATLHRRADDQKKTGILNWNWNLLWLCTTRKKITNTQGRLAMKGSAVLCLSIAIATLLIPNMLQQNHLPIDLMNISSDKSFNSQKNNYTYFLAEKNSSSDKYIAAPLPQFSNLDTKLMPQNSIVYVPSETVNFSAASQLAMLNKATSINDLYFSFGSDINPIMYFSGHGTMKQNNQADLALQFQNISDRRVFILNDTLNNLGFLVSYAGLNSLEWLDTPSRKTISAKTHTTAQSKQRLTLAVAPKRKRIALEISDDSDPTMKTLSHPIRIDAPQTITSLTVGRKSSPKIKMDTIAGLNGPTTKADDAAANSLPGNRTISGANGLDGTADTVTAVTDSADAFIRNAVKIKSAMSKPSKSTSSPAPLAKPISEQYCSNAIDELAISLQQTSWNGAPKPWLLAIKIMVRKDCNELENARFSLLCIQKLKPLVDNTREASDDIGFNCPRGN